MAAIAAVIGMTLCPAAVAVTISLSVSFGDEEAVEVESKALWPRATRQEIAILRPEPRETDQTILKSVIEVKEHIKKYLDSDYWTTLDPFELLRVLEACELILRRQGRNTDEVKA